MPVESGRRSVVVIGGLGGSDMSSSSIIEGMVEFLLETSDYDHLKKTVNFYFIPLANIDAVKYGSTLTNLAGSNIQECWSKPHKTYEAEVFCLKTFLTEINR